MNTQEVRQNAGQFALLPHQSAVVEAIFNPATKRVLQLRGVAGLGKSTTLVAIAGRLLREQPKGRVLFLAPAAIRTMYVEKFQDTGTPALLIDRYVFRELLDAKTDGELWSGGSVFILSRDFAKQPDILDTLVRAHWNLLIIDEAHWLKGSQAKNILTRIDPSAERIVLASASDFDLSDVLSQQETQVIEWKRDDVVDRNGIPLTTVPAPLLHEFPFHLSQPELNLGKAIVGVSSAIQLDAGPERSIPPMLFRCIQSSPAALEDMLTRLLTRSDAPDASESMEELREEDPEVDSIAKELHRGAADNVAAIARRALDDLETIEIDSKLTAFDGLLSGLDEVQAPKRICILTEYIATLYYLAAEIESLGLPCVLLHSGMTNLDRQESLTAAIQGQSILLATYAVAEGYNFGQVTDLILYDVANNEARLRQALGRFDRIGRQSQLNVHVLVPAGVTDAPMTPPIAVLRELFAERAGLQRNS